LREVGLKNIAKIENLREKLYTYKPPLLLMLKFSLIIKLEKFFSAFHRRKIA
jgi:hypothetical protein